MKIDRLDLLSILAGLALFMGPETSVVKAQNKKKVCGKPMKMVVQPKFTGDDLTAWKDKSVSGRVSVVVNEDGEVIQARVLAASPKEAAEALQSAARQARFKPRPSCGDWKTDIFFTLGH